MYIRAYIQPSVHFCGLMLWERVIARVIHIMMVSFEVATYGLEDHPSWGQPLLLHVHGLFNLVFGQSPLVATRDVFPESWMVDASFRVSTGWRWSFDLRLNWTNNLSASESLCGKQNGLSLVLVVCVCLGVFFFFFSKRDSCWVLLSFSVGGVYYVLLHHWLTLFCAYLLLAVCLDGILPLNTLLLELHIAHLKCESKWVKFQCK